MLGISSILLFVPVPCNSCSLHSSTFTYPFISSLNFPISLLTRQYIASLNVQQYSTGPSDHNVWDKHDAKTNSHPPAHNQSPSISTCLPKGLLKCQYCIFLHYHLWHSPPCTISPLNLAPLILKLCPPVFDISILEKRYLIHASDHFIYLSQGSPQPLGFQRKQFKSFQPLPLANIPTPSIILVNLCILSQASTSGQRELRTIFQIRPNQSPKSCTMTSRLLYSIPSPKWDDRSWKQFCSKQCFTTAWSFAGWNTDQR